MLLVYGTTPYLNIAFASASGGNEIQWQEVEASSAKLVGISMQFVLGLSGLTKQKAVSSNVPTFTNTMLRQHLTGPMAIVALSIGAAPSFWNGIKMK
jgi:hypothetical protein